MVMTVLEAHVAPEKSDALQAAFERGRNRLPSQMIETFLVRDRGDATLWRGISVWKSSAALDEYRASVETPGGVPMFRSVGAEPSLQIFDVVVHGSPA
jgi:quinol monooxygenase YgiN